MTLSEVRHQLNSIRQDRATGGPRFLFRGQNQDYGSITPSIARVPEHAKEAVGQLVRMYQYAHVFASGIGGHRVDRRQGVGFLEHYELPTPFINFSASPEIAIFFALLGARPGTAAVVYTLDLEALPHTALAFELDFLALPIEQAIRHRHWRQDAFLVGPATWKTAGSWDGFDLCREPLSIALSKSEWIVDSSDAAQTSNVLSLANDPLPAWFAARVHDFCQEILQAPLHPFLDDRLQNMLNAGTAGTEADAE